VSGAPAGVRVLAVSPDAGQALRMTVLRPSQAPGEQMYALERDPATAHYAALAGDGSVLAVGSVMEEGHPRDPREGDWRVRGMATRPDLRGRGLGGLVLVALERHARERGARRLWCNARTGARAFYERAGWSIEGEEFEIPEIGPHFVMSKTRPERRPRHD
jgi:GNAT superfamily N-acetyltransferase